MNRPVKLVLPFAGLFALAGAQCATTHREARDSASPVARQAAAAQQRSEEALKRAQEAQQLASEQTKKAEAAQEQVRLDQEKLARDQQIARQEQAKAQQLQMQARLEGERAARETQSPVGALSQQTQQTARGQQMAAGLVTKVRPDEVVVQPPSGDAMSFRIDKQTQVRIAGKKASARQIREGAEARVTYEASSEGPTAVSIKVERSGAAGSAERKSE